MREPIYERVLGNRRVGQVVEPLHLRPVSKEQLSTYYCFRIKFEVRNKLVHCQIPAPPATRQRPTDDLSVAKET